MPEILSRQAWGAEHGRGHATDGAKALVVIHHDGKNLVTKTSGYNDEIAVMRRIERYHVETNGWQGIGYNFVIMPFSGRIFEGRGWGRVGSHVPNNNSSSIGVFLPVNGDVYDPTLEAIQALHWLLAEGVRLEHLSTKRIIRGHQDFNKPGCPGDNVYQKLVRDFQFTAVPTFRDFVKAHPTLRQGKGGAGASQVERNLVMLLQAKLRDRRLLEPRHVTGFFGPLTADAVRAFQRLRGLTPDAVVGPKTWRELEV